MALSYYTESEAPRDFRVSSTESDGHYTKCLLCYTVKRNFYCPECIRAGNFVQSSMPYADRYSEKQAKLLRLKANRRHVLDRCEKLLSPKIKQDTLLTAAKQARDTIDLLRLAIEQRRSHVEERRQELNQITNYNNELKLKLPRYQKRVSSLGKHAASQRGELAQRVTSYEAQAAMLAALRRSRVRQLTKYIFPVYMTYDASDSIEDLEFLGEETEEPPKRAMLHIVTPWVYVDGGFDHIADDMNAVREGAGGGCSSEAARVSAALGLGGQLTALLADTLDTRLPHKLSLNEVYTWSGARAAARGARRVAACAAALCARSHVPLPAAGGLCARSHVPLPAAGGLCARSHVPLPAAGGLCARSHVPLPAAGGLCARSHVPLPAAGGLCALHTLVHHAHRDTQSLGRVECWLSESTLASWPELAPEDGMDDTTHDSEPPEHLHWPEQHEMEELSSSPVSQPPASLVTSAAASIASIWRGWTK